MQGLHRRISVLSNLGNQNRSIIIRGSIRTETVDRLQNGTDQLVSVLTAIFQHLIQAFQAKHLAGRVHGFGDAICVEDDLVPGTESERVIREIDMRHDAERQGLSFVERCHRAL